MSHRYSITDSEFGIMLVAGTDLGVTALSFHASEEEAEAFLKEEFPGESYSRSATGLQEWTDRVLNYLRGDCRELAIPLASAGTTFQRKVWDALQKIPYGQTRTYTQIALELGLPRGVRAVARACATNPVSVIVPCHRVVRTDGSLAGYRWGVERKQRLLERERSVSGT